MFIAKREASVSKRTLSPPPRGAGSCCWARRRSLGHSAMATSDVRKWSDADEDVVLEADYSPERLFKLLPEWRAQR